MLAAVSYCRSIINCCGVTDAAADRRGYMFTVSIRQQGSTAFVAGRTLGRLAEDLVSAVLPGRGRV